MGKRKLIVDVDDTILVTTVKRDYYNSTPIPRMIKKLNDLFDAGFEIVYFTARGQISKEGDLARIEEEVRPDLEDWMDRHGVKRTELIMGKPYGDYYIDDKAMTPETFLETEFDSQLEGRSGAALTRAGEEVVKTCDNAEMQTRWLKMARQLSLPVPRVLSASPEGYRMQFIKGDPAWKSLRSNTVVRMVSYIEFMKGVPALPEFRGSFDSYVQRSVRMLPEDLRGRVVSVSQKWEDHCDTQSSFCHGDLTLDNVIDSPTGPVLIDPSIQKDIWSSYLIDVGRMLQSLEWRYEEKYKGAPVDDSKDVWRGYLLNRLDVPRQLGDLMSLLIHCRILHHQYNHSTEDGNRTLATIFEILRRM